MQVIHKIDFFVLNEYEDYQRQIDEAGGEPENPAIYEWREAAAIRLADALLECANRMNEMNISVDFAPQSDGTAELMICTGEERRHRVWLLLTPDGIYNADGEEV